MALCRFTPPQDLVHNIQIRVTGPATANIVLNSLNKHFCCLDPWTANTLKVICLRKAYKRRQGQEIPKATNKPVNSDSIKPHGAERASKGSHLTYSIHSNHTPAGTSWRFRAIKRTFYRNFVRPPEDENRVLGPSLYSAPIYASAELCIRTRTITWCKHVSSHFNHSHTCMCARLTTCNHRGIVPRGI